MLFLYFYSDDLRGGAGFIMSDSFSISLVFSLMRRINKPPAVENIKG